MNRVPYAKSHFAEAPFVVFYEVTRACDLACRHCRASAEPHADPRELGPAHSLALLAELARFEPKPIVVLTGGDPLKRHDLADLVRAGTAHGLEMALTPSATPLLTREALADLQGAGLARLAVSLDGSRADTHDGVRGFEGTFRRTLQAMADARELGIPLQVNTTVTRDNLHELGDLAELLGEQGIVLWSVFFLVPTGRAQKDSRLEPEQYEEAFSLLWREAQRRPYAIKTTEAPHYRRFVMEASSAREARARVGVPGSPGVAPPPRAPMGANDGKGVLFIGHTGEIFPSGFLPIRAGGFPENSPVEIYRESPVFLALRDPDQLLGKCGQCQYRGICGGSRARAFALTGDMLASEPDCVFQPDGVASAPAGPMPTETFSSGLVALTRKPITPQP